MRSNIFRWAIKLKMRSSWGVFELELISGLAIAPLFREITHMELPIWFHIFVEAQEGGYEGGGHWKFRAKVVQTIACIGNYIGQNQWWILWWRIDRSTDLLVRLG